MKTLMISIISLIFAASVATAEDYSIFDVFSYDPDLDSDFLEFDSDSNLVPDLSDAKENPLAVQQGVGDTEDNIKVEHTESGGIKEDTGVHSDADI